MDNNKDFSLSGYDYDLPKEFIAQHPANPRDSCKLMFYDAKTRKVKHLIFLDIADFFQNGDVIVVNETKVKKSKLSGHKESGGKAYITILNFIKENEYHCLINAKKPKQGTRILFEDDLFCEIIRYEGYGFIVKFNKSPEDFIKMSGKITLPPYIKAKLEKEEDYQTVYSKKGKSIASPTAGLHFTKKLLDKIKKKGALFARVNLTVSIGTFETIKEENLKSHKMHTEEYEITKENADIINNCKSRLFVVGTTSLRAIESSFKNEKVIPGKYDTNLFIYPGYKIKNNIYGMITNFHVPKSSLIMLVAGLIGRNKILSLYEIAKKKKYRFYSFGDAMLITNINNQNK